MTFHTEIIEAPDGKLRLKDDNDPAIQRAVGYKRIFCGLDIAVSRDFSAFAVVEVVQRPTWIHPLLQELEEPEMTLVAGDFIKVPSYQELTVRVVNLMKQPQMARARLAVDGTGVGAAFCDSLKAHPQFERLRVPVTKIQITGGEAESNQTTHYRVARNKLLTDLAVAIQSGALKFADFPQRDTLKSEIETLTLSLSASGQRKIAGGSTKAGLSHSDLAMAAALANWTASNPAFSGSYGSHPLKGMY
ncbi:MAG: hypothetical protein AAFY80_07025 [Pseudomonadota bacterium]